MKNTGDYLQKIQTLLEREQWQESIDLCREIINYCQKKLEENLSTEDYLQIGDRFFQEQKTTEAIAYYRRALQINSQAPQVYQRLAIALEKQEQWQEAALCYRQAIQLENNNGNSKKETAQTYNDRGSIYAQKQQWQQAISAYEKAIELEPQSPEAYRNLARVYQQTERPEAAQNNWEKALHLAPNKTSAAEYLKLGNNFREQGKIDTAIDCYRKAIVLEIKGKEAYEYLGELLTQQKKYNEVVNVYQQAITTNPQDSFFYYCLVKILANQSRWQEAIKVYQKILTLETNNLDLTYFNLAKVYEHVENWQEAITCYQKAIEIKPSFWEAHYHLGVIFQQQQQWQDALNSINQSLRLEGNYSWSHYYLGKIFQQQGNKDAAAASYNRAIELREDVDEFYYALAKVLLEKKQTDSALNYCHKAVVINPNRADYYLLLAQIAKQQGEPQEATINYLKTLEINPDTWEAYIDLRYNLLRYHLTNNDPLIDRAIDCFRKIIEQKPELFLARSALGYALAKKGELAESIEIYQQSNYENLLKVRPNFQPADFNTKETKTPDFILIGAEKCGTTSLYQYLIQHPQFLPSLEKELDFFDLEFNKGVDWYLAHFAPAPSGGKFITGEASANYIYSQKAPERIFQIFPEIKLILLLRNPSDRTISRYHMMVKNGWEKRTLAEVIEDETSQLIADSKTGIIPWQTLNKCRHLGNSLYFDHLHRWLSIFSREQLLIIKSEDLYENTPQTLKKIYQFLGIEDYQLPEYKKFNSGNYDAIDEELRQALNEFFAPHNQKLEDYLGRNFNWNKSLDSLQPKVFVIKKQSAQVYANQGSLYAQKEQWQKAIDSYQKALELDPKFAGAYRNLARVYNQLGATDAANQCWYQALILEPSWANPKEHYQLGNALASVNQIEQAINCYQQAIKFQPDLIENYAPLGEIFAKQGKWSEAINIYRQAVIQAPENPSYQFSLAQALTRQDNWKEAAIYLEKTIELQPNNWIAQYNLGCTFAKLDKPETAANCYQKAITLKPDFPWAYNNLGEIYLEESRWQEAISVFLTAIQIQEQLSGIYKKLGYALRQSDSPNLTVKPENNHSTFYARLGDLLEQEQQFIGAIIAYSQALSLQPDDSIKQKLDQTKAKQESLKEKIVSYRHAISEQPQQPHNYSQLGNILAEQGEFAEAISLHRRASSLKGWEKVVERNYRFKYDWFTHNLPIWQKYLQEFIHQPELNFLEIGSFEGMATCWLLDNILTSPSAKITCIDIFFQKNFDFNITQTGVNQKITKLVGNSAQILPLLQPNTYDLIYIDGSHLAEHVKKDAELSWKLLKHEGMIIFDDYEYQDPQHVGQETSLGIDAFLNSIVEEFTYLHQGYQLIIKKN